jgi:hypothetical protein
MSGGKKTGKKGIETEEIVRSYFLGAGFFVVRGVKLRHGDDDLTDIDLWLYERSATLARRRIIIDVKDNAQPKAAERLFFIRGLAEIIQVEACGVVTSDSRRSLRELARKHNVLWIDNADLQRLKSSQKLAVSPRITDDMLNDLISHVDTLRSSRDVRDAFSSIKSSVADRFGPSCANRAAEKVQYFCRLAVEAHPHSLPAQVFTRLAYFGSAIAAAALDFSSGETALRPNSERLANLTYAIRFGDDFRRTADKLLWAEAAIREFAPGGAGVAEVVRSRFHEALRSVPAETLAEVAVKMANSDRLFRAARDLEAAAYSINLTTFDELSLDARSFLGAVLDFVGIERVRFAKCWQPVRSSLPAEIVSTPESSTQNAADVPAGNLQISDLDHDNGKLL